MNKKIWYSVGLIVLQFILIKFGLSAFLANQFGIPATQAFLILLMLISIFFAVRSMDRKETITIGIICILVNLFFGFMYFLAPYFGNFPL